VNIPKRSGLRKSNYAFEKSVQRIFSNVSGNYDLMNNIMSLGMHKLWKQSLINELTPGNTLLDIAGGTGDIAKLFVNDVKTAVVCDLNESMMAVGKKNLKETAFSHLNRISWVQGNAESLPFTDELFELCSIAFGIRNISNISQALREAYRVLKVGGKFCCLEFSNVTCWPIKQFYDFYSLKCIPQMGDIIANDRDAYTYLVDSIRAFPTACVFASMLEDAGFKSVWYTKKTFGIVAIHIGYKI
jgi:ubiquinone/menaquinone biosynthesis methyltransferase